jgi:hypothetical protein
LDSATSEGNPQVANSNKGIGKPAAIAMLLAATAFWVLVYFMGVPAISRSTGISQEITTLIVAVLALAFGIPAMLIGKSMARKEAAERSKNG